ncbi:hypothetical protein VTN00DRAFT_23 [Thermoascus crustaceus]|uniref:uncharacterized protein n=1 Tax=Thermoascus crustaceus TaxID=5088 RepID=UPI0037420EDA
MSSENTDPPLQASPTESAETNGMCYSANLNELCLSTGSELSRIASRAGIVISDGYDVDDDDDEEGEEVDEDFVAVDHEDINDFSYYFRRPPIHQPSEIDKLHPFVQLLSLSNVDDCVKVEEAFPENERCSKEKFIYRLTKAPELSLGLFTLPTKEADEPKPRATLVGHIIATRTEAPRVTDASMALPPDWQSKPKNSSANGHASEPLGHQEQGGTIAIHSLAVLPEHQGKKVGTTLMKSYIQRIKDAMIADRLALLTHEPLVPFYESLGFENRGPSQCTFGGGGWIDMTLEFNNE